MTALLAAIQFLTRLPIRAAFPPAAHGRAVGWYPLVGAGIGSALAGLDWLLGWLFAPPVVAALLVAAGLLITGALHFDGLLDSADGLFAARSPAERLAIMRDSRVGGFGVAAGASLLLLKFAAIQALPWPWRGYGLWLGPLLARWAMAFALVRFPYGRQDASLGKMVRDSAGGGALLLASALTLLALVAAGRPVGFALGLLTLVSTFALARYVLTRLPGLTGDVYGAIGELQETLVWLALPPLVGWLPWVWRGG